MGCINDDSCILSAQRRIRRLVIYSVIGFLVAGVITAIVVLVLRFAVKPHVETNIEDARLNSFDFGTTETGAATASFLAYNISVAISVHNPNGATIKYTKPLIAAIAFHGHRLVSISVAGQGHKYRPGKKEVHLLHTRGEVPSHVLGTAAVDDFKKQNETGVFNIEARLSGQVTYLGLDIVGNKRNLGFSCPLSLQLAPPGPEVVVFHEVNCQTEPEDIYF